MDLQYEDISDFDLEGIVDGAFDNQTHERLMAAVKCDSSLLSRLENLFYQKQMLKEWWRSQPLL